MRLTRPIKISSFIIVLLALLFFLQEIVVKPWTHGDVQIAGFYGEPENSLDVVMIGASDIYFDFSPCLAYDQYGFTSYAFAPPRNSVSMWKTQLDEALRTQTPELFVIEVNGALYEEEELDTDENIHFFTDNMPFSKNMLSLIRDHAARKNRLACFIPYLKYHGNISSLSQVLETVRNRMDFLSRGRLYMHGQRTRLSLIESELPPLKLSDDHSTLPLEPNHEKSLREFLEYCRDEIKTPVLFFRAPHCVFSKDSAEYEFFRRANRIGEIISEYGFEYWNYDTEPKKLMLEYPKDFNDPEHLSAFGQQKFTDVFGRLLLEKYGVGGASNQPEIKKIWQEGLVLYHAYMNECFRLIEAKDTDEYQSMEYESPDAVDLVYPDG